MSCDSDGAEYSITQRRSSSPLMVSLIGIGGCLVLGTSAVGVVAGALFPVFNRTRAEARSATCLSNARQLSVAMRMYVQNNDERFPPAPQWTTGLTPYVKDANVFRCPARAYLPSGFAYNRALDVLSLNQIKTAALTPMLHESLLGLWNSHDRLETFAVPHDGAGNVGFVDGHVQSLVTAPQADAGLAPPSKAP
jgi:prepilin-type processing-associated H-X9-DG protein